MLFWVVFLFPFLWIALYFVVLQLFFNAMKEEDNDLWVKMGSPHIISNNSIKVGLAVLTSFANSSFTSSTKKVSFWGNVSRVWLILTVVVLFSYPKFVEVMGFGDFMWNS